MASPTETTASETSVNSVPEGPGTGRGPSIRIEAPRGAWASLRLRELWEYRELLYFFVWRDVKVRYKQTIFGGLWAIIRPLFTMVVFSIFFGGLADVPSDDVPYPIFSFAALVPWQFFEQGIVQSAESLVANARLVTKVYFPRLTIPIAAVLSGLVDLGVAFAVLLILMAFYGIAPPIQVLMLPLFLLLACVTALAVGLWLAGLNAKFRDVRYTVQFLTQAWLFLTPVAYPSSLLDEPWRTIYALNPMVGVVEGFRWALLPPVDPPSRLILVSSFVAVALLIGGAFYFRRLERTFADIV